MGIIGANYYGYFLCTLFFMDLAYLYGRFHTLDFIACEEKIILIYLVLMSSPEKLKAEQVVEHLVPRLFTLTSTNGKSLF